MASWWAQASRLHGVLATTLFPCGEALFSQFGFNGFISMQSSNVFIRGRTEVYNSDKSGMKAEWNEVRWDEGLACILMTTGQNQWRSAQSHTGRGTGLQVRQRDPIPSKVHLSQVASKTLHAHQRSVAVASTLKVRLQWLLPTVSGHLWQRHQRDSC